jgi:predicted glycoside hydrolase/deacetylase ChbG (UPF0249 family)
MIYVQPELSEDDRSKIEKDVGERAGVIPSHFDHHKHPHALMVLYNLDAISEKEILASVRKYDPAASMVGL